MYSAVIDNNENVLHLKQFGFRLRYVILCSKIKMLIFKYFYILTLFE